MATMATVYQAVRLPGETLLQLKEQARNLTEEDKLTLIAWKEAEEAATKK